MRKIGRVFITGDKHGGFYSIYDFCQKAETTNGDILIIAGDAGINYYLNKKDKEKKAWLSNLPITLLILHGNHEERAWNIDTYRSGQFRIGGNLVVGWYEEEYPNIIFLSDYYTTILNGKRYLFLGGAYSIDKYYRLTYGYQWFESEQIPPEQMEDILDKIEASAPCYDYVVSHTWPQKYEPVELFLSGIDQSTVDKRTEEFLDKVEKLIEYEKWYFAHGHGDFDIGKARIIFHDFVELR